MNKLSLEEEGWLIKNFALSSRDLPIDFIEPKEYIEILFGKSFYRPVEWPADSLNFAEELYMAVLGHEEVNKERFKKLVMQMLYLESECERLEYYLLLGNIKELIKSLKETTRLYNDHHVEQEINSLLKEMGL
jgi:hypothetical protein